jgi:hypothetical protein
MQPLQQAQSSELKGLSSAKKRIVDEMWVEMNEQDKREVDEKHAAAVELSYGNPSSKVRRAKQQERLDTVCMCVLVYVYMHACMRALMYTSMAMNDSKVCHVAASPFCVLRSV